MTDQPVVMTGRQTRKRNTSKAMAKRNIPATQPLYSKMIEAAITSLKEKDGSSVKNITKFICANYKAGDEKSVSNSLKRALEAGLNNGTLKQTKIIRNSGYFQLAETTSKSEPNAAELKPVPSKTAKRSKNKRNVVSKKAGNKQKPTTTRIPTITANKGTNSAKKKRAHRARKAKAAKEKTTVIKIKPPAHKEHGNARLLKDAECETAVTANTRIKKKVTFKLQPTKQTQLDIKSADDEFTSCVYGMDITKNGTLLVADHENKTIKVLSADNHIHTVLALPHNPYDVAVINDSTAAVTLSNNILQILNISDSFSPSVQNSIDLGFDIAGLTICEGNLVVTNWDKPECVKMIDTNGKLIWSVYKDNKGKKLFQYPRSVAATVINDKMTIIVTDEGNNTLTLLDAKNGNFIKTIDVNEKSPHGITADEDGNIYVCYHETDEIGIWSADLNKCRILLSERDLHKFPQAVCFNAETDELIVGYFDRDTIDRFRLS